jgi:hypothetical protein
MLLMANLKQILREFEHCGIKKRAIQRVFRGKVILKILFFNIIKDIPISGYRCLHE